MVPDRREECLERCVAYHGHICTGQILGVRIALKGMELVGTTDPRKLIVFIENDRCIADAIQIVTGTRIGRRSAKLVNYGKMAAVFLNTDTQNAYRVSIRPFDKVDVHDQEAARKFLHGPDEELLSWKKVQVHLNREDYPGKPLRTVTCVGCGERVFDCKEVVTDQGPMCSSCKHGAYYQSVEQTL